MDILTEEPHKLKANESNFFPLEENIRDLELPIRRLIRSHTDLIIGFLCCSMVIFMLAEYREISE